MNYKIVGRADADIEEITEHIARDSVSAALRWNLTMRDAIRKLAEVPGMGHQRADVADERYRFFAVGKYIIAYRIEDGILFVVRVLHGARDFRNLFK